MSRKTEAGLACTIGIDTGKNTLHLVGLDAKGAVVLREKLARGRIAARLANVPPCLIGIEAGMATPYVARELLVLGHETGATVLRQTISSRSQERLPGRPRDCRSSAAPIDALCSGKDRRSARAPGAAPCAVSLDRWPDYRDQSDPQLPIGARHYRTPRPSLPAATATTLATRTDVLSPRMIRIIEDLSSD